MISAIFGPLPVDEGIERCKEFLAMAGDDPTIRAFCCVERAVLEAMSGEFELARELLAEGTQAITDLGLTVWAANNAQETFFVETLAGDSESAADTLRASYATLEELGERGFLSSIAGFLAHTLCALGEFEEADRFSRAGETAATPDDVHLASALAHGTGKDPGRARGRRGCRGAGAGGGSAWRRQPTS